KSAVVRTKHEMRQSIDDDPVAFLRKHNAPKELIDIARRVTGPILRGSTDPKQIQDAMAVRAEFAAALEEFANQGGFGSKVRGRAALRGFEQRYLTPLHAIQQRLTTRNLGAAFSRRGAGGMTDEEATALRAQFAMQHGMLSPSTTESFT